jgi:very-short-patch-repair endonuclease
MENELDTKILEILSSKPGLLARDIASQIGIDRKLVNSALYGRLRSMVRQDNNYRWYLVSSKDNLLKIKASKTQNIPLAQLSRYYLDCLSHEDIIGISEFVSSGSGDRPYVELSSIPQPLSNANSIFESDDSRRLLSKIRRSGSRAVLILGYPIRMNLIHSKKGWEGFRIEPLFLFSFEDLETSGYPVLSQDSPQINIQAIRSLMGISQGVLMEESIQLSEELGLADAVNQPPIDEMVSRLHDIRPDWDWRENPDPETIITSPPLSGLKAPGIYNRAVLFFSERSPYTRGLESELSILQTIDETKYEGTSLGVWFSGKELESPPGDQKPLLEVIPLNTEQRQAVRQALTNKVTVITGPPGTGKSQVVTSILVNAAWQGKTVLFASKNNKAVDVVETRVNALGPRNILLRLGMGEYQKQLARYLTTFLAASVTEDDLKLYSDYEIRNTELQHRCQELDKNLDKLVGLRNEVDKLDQKVEIFRKEVGDSFFSGCQSIDSKIQAAVNEFVTAVNTAVQSKKSGLLARIFFRHIMTRNLSRVQETYNALKPWLLNLGLSPFETELTRLSIEQWANFASKTSKRLNDIQISQQYFMMLKALSEMTSAEEISKERTTLTNNLKTTSEVLWRAWLQVQPSRLKQEQRKLLGDYDALLQLIVSADDEDRRLGREVFSRYNQLFPQIKALMPCWAVTSLSARGRIPLEANFFDLLVIDESSQCDIASALPLLYRSKSVVVIGDPMQLRHISTITRHQEVELQNKHGILATYPSWAYSTRSLFDLARSLCRNEDIVALRDHHRSHQDIIEFSNQTFYQGRLRVATKMEALRHPIGNGPAVRWIDLPGKVIRPSDGGAINEKEATAVVTEIKRLLTQGYHGTVGVISPFRAQAIRIRDLIESQRDISQQLEKADFLVNTVHAFQGDERDLMIFSPVVSEGITEGALGFLRSNPNLFNVAVTRARAALVVVGDYNAAVNSNVDYLAKFAVYSQRLNNHVAPSKESIFSDLGPEYPKVDHPELVSDWERYFYRVLYQEGLRPIPQYIVDRYTVDLALFSGSRRLDIEVDGEQYHRNWTGDLCQRDQIRNQRLMELGWDVMRFWVYQIRDDLPGSILRVRQWINNEIKVH